MKCVGSVFLKFHWILFQDAFVENLDENQLFTAMFKDDHEGQKLLSIPGAAELLQQIEQRFMTLVHTMFESGLKVCSLICSQYFQLTFRRFSFASRKKNFEIGKLKIFGFVSKKQKKKIRDVLQR